MQKVEMRDEFLFHEIKSELSESNGAAAQLQQRGQFEVKSEQSSEKPFMLCIHANSI